MNILYQILQIYQKNDAQVPFNLLHFGFSFLTIADNYKEYKFDNITW